MDGDLWGKKTGVSEVRDIGTAIARALTEVETVVGEGCKITLIVRPLQDSKHENVLCVSNHDDYDGDIATLSQHKDDLPTGKRGVH